MPMNERKPPVHPPKPANLEARYGKIGIPAVKAAAPYCGKLSAAARLPTRDDRPGRSAASH